MEERPWPPQGWGVAALSPCLKCTLPWQLTALTSFLGIGPGAAEGLLKQGSETLLPAMSSSAPQWWTLLLVPCGSGPQRPLVIGKHGSLLPYSAPSLTLTGSPVSHVTLSPRTRRVEGGVGWTWWAALMNTTILRGWRGEQTKAKGKGKIPFRVGTDRCFIFRGESRSGVFRSNPQAWSFVQWKWRNSSLGLEQQRHQALRKIIKNASQEEACLCINSRVNKSSGYGFGDSYPL